MNALVTISNHAGLMRMLLHPEVGERRIFLLECHVAGVRYYDAPGLRDVLHEGLDVELRRQPANPHDELAIEVLLRGDAGGKLGYVPRAHNTVLARLMDAGKRLDGRLTGIDFRHAEWLDIGLRIEMVENVGSSIAGWRG